MSLLSRGFLAALLSICAVCFVFAADPSSEFLDRAEYLSTEGIISKAEKPTEYRLDDKITRAQMAKIIVNMRGVPVAKSCLGTVYADVKLETTGDLCRYIEAAASVGMIDKTKSRYRPNELVSRAELAKMLTLAINQGPQSGSVSFYSDAKIEKLGELLGYINAMRAAGCIRADTQLFRPLDSARRGEAFKMAACMHIGARSRDLMSPEAIVGAFPKLPVGATGATTTGSMASSVLGSYQYTMSREAR